MTIYMSPKYYKYNKIFRKRYQNEVRLIKELIKEFLKKLIKKKKIYIYIN